MPKIYAARSSRPSQFDIDINRAWPTLYDANKMVSSGKSPRLG